MMWDLPRLSLTVAIVALCFIGLPLAHSLRDPVQGRHLSTTGQGVELSTYKHANTNQRSVEYWVIWVYCDSQLVL